MFRHLAVICSLALLAALLVAGGSVSAQDRTEAFGIRPQDPHAEEIRHNKPIVEDPDGVQLPSGERVASATWVGIQVDGSEVRQAVNRAWIEASEGAEQYIRNSPAGLDLLLNGPCIWGEPDSNRCPVSHSQVVRGYLEVSLTNDGGTYLSTSLGVDYQSPVLAYYRVTSAQTITVVWNEPVRVINGAGLPIEDSPSDWQVEDNQVTRVRMGRDDCTEWGFPAGTSGCTRLLDLAVPVGEDARPSVQWMHQEVADLDDPTRTTYEDEARNFARMQSTPSALDFIRPAIPTIEDVGDRAPTTASSTGACVPDARGRVVLNDPAPTLTASNIDADHRYIIMVDGADQPGEPRPVPADDASVDATLPEALADGTHVVEVVALDPSNNRSDDSGLTGPRERQDGENNPVCLVVDTVAPLPGMAARTDSPSVIVVSFNEPVTDPDAGTWAVGSGETAQTATEVERGESDRQLRVSFPHPVGAAIDRIRWSGSDGDRYRDEAGNVMVDFTLPLTALALPLPPIITVPSADTPRYTNVADYTISGRLHPAQDPADVQRVIVTTPDASSQPEPAAPDADGTWRTPYTFPQDGLYRFTAVAENAVGDRSSQTSSDGEVVFDSQKPVVTLVSPAPVSGPLGLPTGQPEDHPAGEPIDVRIRVEEPHYDTSTVRVSYEDPNPGDENEAPSDTVVIARHGNGLGESFTIPVDVADGFVGRATITVEATDLATNTSDPVSTVVNLTDALTGPIRTDLVSNRPGDTQIELEFAVPLVGTTFPTDWTADNGVQEDRGTRSPLRSTASGNVVTLEFGQPFPGLVAGDRNAMPFVTYEGGVTSSLAAEDGREVIVRHKQARDTDIPDIQWVTPPQVGPDNLSEPAPAGTDCTATPRPAECPLTVTFSGKTHESLRPNFFTVFRVPAADLEAPGTVVATGRATPQGNFSFTVGVTPNATSTFRVEVEDPQGNVSPGTIVRVIEDSLGPAITTLLASLEDADTVDISVTTAPEDAVSVELSYVVAGGTPEQIATVAVNRTTGTARHDWDLPEDIDLTTEGLQIIAVARDAVGNAGPRATTGLSNVPELSSAVALSLTEVAVTTTEPVTTDEDRNAGFAIDGGPGVASTSVDEQGRIILVLNSELPATSGLGVAYNGQGRWTSEDGRPLRRGRVPLASLPLPAGTALAVTGLAAGPACTDGVVLSWIDERNTPGAVSAYEIARDGELIATVSPETRIFTDADAPDGPVTYTVSAIAAEGASSDPVTFDLVNGVSPVPGAQGRDAMFAGTGAPTVAAIVADGHFTAEPTIGPEGGTVLSCDGRVALLVPPGVASEPMFAKVVQRTAMPAAGFTALTDLYQVVAVAADDFTTVDRLTGYAEVSVRDLRASFEMAAPELATALRLGNDGRVEEQAPRVGAESLATQLITFGAFQAVEADGRTIRVFGPDPAIASDRFATAAGLSQTQHRRAGEAVIARADDYPDALASAPLAALVGGPVLLTRTSSLPATTLLELRRLGVSGVTLVGGTEAISTDVEAALAAEGFTVRRIGGATRFDTAALVAEEVGSVDGSAFLATGLNFADALSASAPASGMGRPILLTPGNSVADATLGAAHSLGLDGMHVVGGSAAISDEVVTSIEATGIDIIRSAGPTRYATAVDLAGDLLETGDVRGVRPLIASGDGDGITSPDALAAGPVGGRLDSYLLLTPQGRLPQEVEAFLQAQEAVRGMILAGGPAAVSPEVRRLIDATG